MPNYAVIENEKVVNTVVADPDFAAAQGWVELIGGAGIGWSYTDGQFVDTRVFPDSQPTPVSVPADPPA